ncbi:protein C2-DOMAIN ABA-RELATED 7-like [Andrographis paniculata]|uniref:protein C2-DOMAIN ABA-RELATED 7-like n=1 Tax=Andrographis paniculata TaxID=175694 RepID=UPI0021E893FD|nr:protein C2-DOMAIN ABA-RELATED 7-like [Andrographis paniculata]
MDVLGLLKIRVQKGINLAVRDTLSSDPYCVITCENQRVRTKVVKRNCNPVWSEELTIYIKDLEDPIVLSVYDKDTFSGDDNMGHANIDIIPLIECLKMGLENLPDGTKVERVQPTRSNCLADESCVVWEQGKMTQDMSLRLKDVECGEVAIQIEWVDVPGAKGLQVEIPDKHPHHDNHKAMRSKKMTQVVSIVSTVRRRLRNKTISVSTKVLHKPPHP